MTTNNIYSIRCQLYQHKGEGFIVEISEKKDDFVLYHQSDRNNPSRQRVSSGRIDFDVPLDTIILPKTVVEGIISKVKTIQVPFLPPMTGGFDGVDYKLWLINGMSVLHASWWLDCPPQWKPLQSLWDSIVALKVNHIG